MVKDFHRTRFWCRKSVVLDFGRGCLLLSLLTDWCECVVWFIFKQRTSIGKGFLWGATKKFEAYRQSNFKKGTCGFMSGDSGGVWSVKFWLTFPSLLKLEGHGPSSHTPVDLSLQPRNSCKCEKILTIRLDCMMALWFRRLSLLNRKVRWQTSQSPWCRLFPWFPAFPLRSEVKKTKHRNIGMWVACVPRLSSFAVC